MPHCRRVLVLLLLLTVTIDLGTHALKCRLYHRIWEDGHLLRINPDICHTSSKYCVRATYADPDDRKKNGFSMGCDKVDCQGIDNPNFTGWHLKPNGEHCRKSRDYGKKGEICCCPSDMCNSSNRLPLFGMILMIDTIQQPEFHPKESNIRTRNTENRLKTARQKKVAVSRICLHSMNGDEDTIQRQRITSVHSAIDNYITNVKANLDIWGKQLGNLEKSLKTMRDELFRKGENEGVTITGQILIASAAERAEKLVKEANGSIRVFHTSCSKIGKNVDRYFDKDPVSLFKLDLDMSGRTSQKNYCCSMIYDFVIADGMNDSADTLKQEALLKKYKVDDPILLKRIVDDLRQGDIGSSLGIIDKIHPQDENRLRKNLQTQMITDCIEIDNYERAVGQIKRFRIEWKEEADKAPRLLGALLVGKKSMYDVRYRYLFNYINREQLSLKMASFFMPNDAPLKMILRCGGRTLAQLSEMCAPVSGSYYVESELPREISMNPTHSAFNCPILKVQCSSLNRPMRLICGHVISRDAINRLTTSLRQVRNSSRSARFKCPYCPREQYLDSARVVNFDKWCPDFDDDDIMDVVS